MPLHPLGRRIPPNFDHLSKRYGDIAPITVPSVEKELPLPSWHPLHDQGEEGACVGFGTSMMQAINNTIECVKQGAKNPYVRYNPFWLWDRAKEIDPWPDTNPGDENGTLVSSACTILQTRGHVIWENEADPHSYSAELKTAGIAAVRWARTMDEVRTAIANDQALSIGVNWYAGFDTPYLSNGEYWIQATGVSRGGHCVCIYGASDKRQAVKIKNSWGASYPEVWMPYQTLARLISEQGEVALITDK